MSEEKKPMQNTDEGKGHKQHAPRRHGYFINPNAPAEAPKIQEVPVSDKPQQGNTPNQSRKGKSHNNHRNDNKARTAEQPAEIAKKAEAPASAEPQRQNPPSQKKKNKNKNKPKTSTPQQPSPSPAPARETKPARTSNRPLQRESKPRIEHNADAYEEYKLPEPVMAPPKKSAQKPKDENAPKTEVVGIRFKSTGKIYYFDPKGYKLKKGSHAIVDTARGQEFGEVAMANSFVSTSDIVPPLRAVIRAATTADIEHNAANKQKEEEAFKICNEKIIAHKLEMKLIDAQYTFDNSKLLFYFTSSDRVDFRELVKDLASVFRTRIELRQIGIRDEAKIMGGLGMCGRPLCCTLFLSDFDQVSIKMAKEQNLSLNSSKISGICGRLMCCLKYEHEAYEYEIKRTPPVDSLVRTENGDGIVTEISPLRGTLKVRLLASPELQPKTYHRDNVTMLRKKQSDDKK